MRALVSIIGLAAIALLAGPAAAETIKVGLLKVSVSGPMMIAQEKGYFAKEGLSADLVFFDAATVVSEGIRAGDLDFGIAAVNAGFFNTAGQGAMRIIAGDGDESPGFRGVVAVASNRAYDAGLRSFRDLPGHSFVITGAGTLQQYDLGVIAKKYRFDYASMRMLPVSSFPNMVAAVVSGSGDSAFPGISMVRQALAGGKVHRLGWISDELRMQIAVVMTSGEIADGKPELVRRFLRVFRMGVKDYRAAFTGPDERPLDGPTADETYAIIAKYTGMPIETMKLGLTHLDAEGRLDVASVMDQIAWYKSQGMVKPGVDGSKIIDRRYVVPLPTK